jgi:3-dehydroquinate synthetase
MPELIAKTAGGDYPITIRKGALHKTGQIAAEICRGRRVCIVSDETCWPLYGEIVSNS